MADEVKDPQSKTIGHIDVSKLEALPKWKDFVKKAETARVANEAHEAAKRVMREEFKKVLKGQISPNATRIDFLTSGNRVTVTEYYEKKKAEKPRAADLSDLFT
jgi:hypothetical protein